MLGEPIRSKMTKNRKATKLHSKKEKLPKLPAQLVHDRIMISRFLFLSEPVEKCPPVDLPHIQSVKEQIFDAQVQCNALSCGSKFKRSTRGNKRVRKLKKRVRWLCIYFLESATETRPDGRKTRRIINTQPNKIPKIPKTSPKSLKSVTARKRRKSRPPRKIHRGPYHAHGSLPPPRPKTPVGPRRQVLTLSRMPRKGRKPHLRSQDY